MITSITSGDPAVTRVTVADVLPWQPCQWTQGWRTQEDLSGPSGSEIVWDRESMVGGMFGVTTETPSVSNHNKAAAGGRGKLYLKKRGLTDHKDLFFSS